MLLTDDHRVIERCRYISAQAHEPGTFWNTEVGYKYAMSNMQAALGLAQLERVEELVAQKQEIFAWYSRRLGSIEGLQLNPAPKHVKNSYWMVTVIPDDEFGVTKQELIASLRESDIVARPFFHPLSSLPAYRKTPSARSAATDNPVAYRLSVAGINLPSGFNMTEEKVEFVCDALEKALRAGSGTG